MGRAPCCDKATVKKGPWSPEEDAKLKSYIEQHGTGGNWIALPQKIGLKRCGKSCRLRWLNYLRPNIKHGGFSDEEDKIICSLYVSIGSRWSIIAAQLPGRTDNDIKNYWNTRLKKKLLGKQRKEQQSGRGNSLKQEMKKGNEVFSIVPDHNNQNPYWPQLPVLTPIPYSSQEHHQIDSQASMRRLLIKLGGRFCDEVHQHQVINDGSTTTLHQQNIYLPFSSSSSSSAMDGLNNKIGADQFMNSQYSTIDELHEMAYRNPQRLDGMEFLYGEDVVNHRALNTSESIGWTGNNTSTLICPPVGSDYEGIQQEMQQQQYGFNKLRYPGALRML